MNKNNEKNQMEGESSPKTMTSELKGRQSVRATLRLTEGCIAAIHIVATQMGIKQKSLFDHIAEDVQNLASVADKIKNTTFDKHHRIQKTFVMSKKSLSCLDEVAKNFNTQIDAIIELYIQRFLPMISREQVKHNLRKEFLVKIKQHLKKGEEILGDIQKQLGSEDPIAHKFNILISSYESVKDSLETFIEKSKGIEKFDADILNHKK